MGEDNKKILRQMYELAQEFMADCPDEENCSDAENEVVDEVANLMQAIKNAKLV